MTRLAGSGVSATAAAVPLLEALDATSYAPPGTGTQQGVILSGSSRWLATTGLDILKQFFPTMGAAVTRQANGINAYEFVGAAATYKVNVGGLFIPYPQRRTVAPLIPSALMRNLRFTYELAAWRSASGAGGVFSLKIGSASQPMESPFNHPGVAFEVSPLGTVWRVRHRKVAGAAWDTDVSTGLSVDVPRRFKFVFDTGPTPAFTLSIDGTAQLTVSGEANMPEISTAVQAGALNVGNYDALGTTDRCAFASCKVEEL